MNSSWVAPKICFRNLGEKKTAILNTTREFESKNYVHLDAFQPGFKMSQFGKAFTSMTLLSIHPFSQQWAFSKASDLRPWNARWGFGVSFFVPRWCGLWCLILKLCKAAGSCCQKSIWRQESKIVRVSPMNAVLKKPLVPVLHWNISQIFQFASRRHRPDPSPWVPVQRCKCWL